MSISLSHLTKRYGADTVVDDVTVEIPESSLTAVLGPSGSGKSTLLKLIAGLESPDEGRVVIEGDDVTDVDPRYRDIGFCFQHYAPFRHMNVARNIGFGLRVRKQPKDVIDAKVAELIELVRLDGKAKSYPAQLSGGASLRDGRSAAKADPAASANAWRWRGRWRSSPACSCSTSRSGRWTRWCALSCANG